MAAKIRHDFLVKGGNELFERERYDGEVSDIDQAMELRQRELSREQMQRFEGYISEIFGAFGMDLHTPSTEETPRRFLQALFEATEGYDGDPKLLTVFDTECRGEPDCRLGQVIEGPIPFYALCEHHALPFFGHAYVGYIPHEHIIGISKLTRLVRLFAKRFAVQERLGEQIVNTFETMLAPHGVAVYLEAHHLCVAMRGVRDTSPLTHTMFWRGEYAKNDALRAEFLLICQGKSKEN
ncbi:GTP cyclohydrolase I [Dictyobacter formicarum]|uniref:GTP cyclohydrolase 1 n=1 Tax=Dictyobacter formicarum TaxID=2778368 RepID=A0ABQ3VG01_9CHLR|nr:GTP cyclohydrolase I [Dictyobacter formicarum]GHO84748.1 GTP cyclohydrolase 1 [Dictyobacter formicarum]